MATSTMRSLKSQEEFVAHEANVNCLALGQKSGRVLVTGGDDKKVNLWAIGTTNYVLSLNAHTSPVECVKFGHTEEFVCSGSQAGELYIWDLEANRKTRTFIGHTDAIKCMDFHPYGDFLASGSLDTFVKLWDLRRKGCISTYKGHVLTVNSVRFSPDGLWLASGGDDGIVKLWDVRVGRLLQQFPYRSASVLAVEFHPHEFLLASGTSDGTVNFWDLEKFQLVSTTEKAMDSISCLHFSPEGECLYAGVKDRLKIFGWEPARTFDSVLTRWGRVQDMVKTPNQLIGASFQKSKVILQEVNPKVLRTKPDPSKINTNFVHNSTRKSFSKEKFSPPKMSLKTMEDSGEEEEEKIVDSTAAFQPQRTLMRTPPPIQASSPPFVEPDSSTARITSTTFDVEPVSLSSLHSDSRVHVTLRSPSPRLIKKEMPFSVDVKRENRGGIATRTKPQPQPPIPPDTSENNGSSLDRPNPNDVKTDASLKMNNVRHNSSESTVFKPPATARTRRNSVGFHSNGPLESIRSEDRVLKARDKATKNSAAIRQILPPAACFVTSSRSADASPEDEFVSMSGDKPAGLSLDDFMPKNATSLSRLPASVNVTEAEVLSSVVGDHDSVMSVLSTRQKSLRIVYSVWHSKDAKAAIDSAVAMGNPSVVVDLLGVLVLRPSIWTLDMCGSVLPSVTELLQSKYELHMTAGCTALSLILRNFAHIIKTNVQAPIQTVGVDISREERYNKCLRCYRSLLSIRPFLLKRQTMQGKLGNSFRELLVLMKGLEN